MKRQGRLARLEQAAGMVRSALSRFLTALKGKHFHLHL
jgi:hypothetical protein